MDAVYLDYAATTPADSDALDAAMPYFRTEFYNPSSAHTLGQRAAAAVEHARALTARAINAAPDEIVFTSGGTEAINQAFSCIEFCENKRVIISAIEHDSVVACAERLKNLGCDVDIVPPTRDGIITPEALEKSLKNGAGLVCVMTVNNQTGAIQPVKALCDVAHAHGALFFTDAVQAIGCVDTDVKLTGVDMLAASAHKFYSIKGAGFLYVKRGVKIHPLIVGGEQEKRLRAGTLNVPAIAAMGVAIQKAAALRDGFFVHAKKISDTFLNALEDRIPVVPSEHAPHILTVIFDGVNGGRLVTALSIAGVCCSVGSACSAGSATPPPTLVAMGIKNADCAVRFSFGRETTEEQVIKAAYTVNAAVKRLKNVGCNCAKP